MAEKLSNYKYKTPIPIRFSDMDAFGHVNNAIYLTYFEIARSNYWRDIIGWDWNETEERYFRPLGNKLPEADNDKRRNSLRKNCAPPE